jgi:hypothetical protein
LFVSWTWGTTPKGVGVPSNPFLSAVAFRIRWLCQVFPQIVIQFAVILKVTPAITIITQMKCL